MTVAVPGDALVVLAGSAGSGKSTLAARHFAPDEILSSDTFRAVVAGNEADQSANDEAFALLHARLEARLRSGLRSVVDATNVEGWARRQLLEIAERHGRPAVAIVLDLPVELCVARAGRERPRSVPAGVVRRQHRRLRRALAQIGGEGFERIVVISDPADLDRLRLVREPGVE